MNFAERRGEITPTKEFVLNPPGIREAVRRAGFNTGDILLIYTGAVDSSDGAAWITLDSGQRLNVIDSVDLESVSARPLVFRVSDDGEEPVLIWVEKEER